MASSLPFTITSISHSRPLSRPNQSVSSIINNNDSYFQRISYLSKHRKTKEAMDLFTQMELRQVRAQPEIYAELLQGCFHDQHVSLGRQIHARIIKSGDRFSGNEYVETKLVILYSKSDDFSAAARMFRSASSRNVFSWSAIIGLNCRMGFCEEALLGFCEMFECGFSPDNFIVPNALKSCGALQWVRIGKSIHGYALKMGFVDCVFVNSSLIDMYGKCGCLKDARKVFDEMPKRNVVTWNSMIVGYVQNKMNEEAMKIFYDMRMAGVEPTDVTISSSLSASANLNATNEGKQIHALAILEGIVSNTVLGSSIINFYAKTSSVNEAELVFNRIVEKDLIMWNLIISGYVQIRNIEKMLDMCRRMRSAKMRFDSMTLSSLMSASAKIANLELGKVGHCYCIRNNLDTDAVVATSLVNMYAKCNKINHARQIFDSVTKRDLVMWNTILSGYTESGLTIEASKLFNQMNSEEEEVQPDVISWNSLIAGFLKNGQVKEAKNAFLEMKSGRVSPNLVTWTSLISGLNENGFCYEAIKVFRQMQEFGKFRPNIVTIVSVLSACVDMGLINYGKAIHCYVTRHFVRLSAPVSTALVDMYAKCGNLEQSKRMFDIVEDKEVATYNAMIAGYGLHGRAMEALELYGRLVEEEKNPDSITFTSTLNACVHSGLANEGLEIFTQMVSRHGLNPSMVHYGCMINLLTRNGDLDGAFSLINSMPYEPDARILGSVLVACRGSNRAELASYLSEKLMELEPNNSGNYVEISNAYAAMGKWDRVENVRLLMKQKGLFKVPGCSWILVGDEFHVFLAGDRSHSETKRIYMILSLLGL